MRYKKHTREEIDRAIHDSSIAGLTTTPAIQFVLDRTGITISHTQLVERKRILRNRSKEQWLTYVKNDYAYRIEHLQRLAEARQVKEHAAQKEMEYAQDSKKFFQWKTAAYALMEASRYLNELHSMIPEIDSIGHEVDEAVSQVQPEEYGKTPTQKGRVF